ncbi:MAG: rhodanese-like domain-containing protein [Candidatus Zixiibacteriota bacterium]|nr:MAG: rhodanese-like domain-containing protein [candidate division Zixibacteria bacterium]
MKIIRDAFLIVVLSAIFGLLINAVRNATGVNGLAMDTPWPENREKVELEKPPSYTPCDSLTIPICDSLVSLEQAYALFLRGDAIFLDTREEFEYDEGHIAGAINLPFDFWDDYWEYVEPELDPEKEIIAYCGGFDCELSLFAARELKSLGYEKSYIFFGGWNKWVEAGLPVEEIVYDDEEEYEDENPEDAEEEE